MSERDAFFVKAIEAITAIASKKDQLDPVLLEIYQRIDMNKLPFLKSAGTLQIDTSFPIQNIDVIENSNTNTDQFYSKMHSASGTLGNYFESSSSENTTPLLASSKSSTQSKIKKTQIENERPFICHICKLRFKRSFKLKRHEKVHLPKLPNICVQCGKGFARKDALKRHFDTLTCRRNKMKRIYLDSLAMTTNSNQDDIDNTIKNSVI